MYKESYEKKKKENVSFGSVKEEKLTILYFQQ